MSLTDVGHRLKGLAEGARQHRFVLIAFAATLFLSATLLFSVQPMFAKMVLPKLGGSPSVWALAMCFFQAVLLAGYLYAHTLNRHFEPLHAAYIHIAVCAFAFLALPIAIPASFAEPPAGDAYFWVIGLFTVAVGLPFFAVSANAPLLQSWFARSGHPAAADPYFLYGASNLGSMASLLAYPFLIEPVIGLSAQSALWTGGFALLATMLFMCVGLITIGGHTKALGKVTALKKSANRARVSLREAAPWIALAFVPSGLLVAYTTHITTDIASAPFLWVLPLALFLLTFVMVFQDKPTIPLRWLLLAQPVLVAVEIYNVVANHKLAWWTTGGIGLLAFFATTLVAHRVLYERRPSADKLTDFYLWMSFGGVLGGVFAALIAPQVFSTVIEYPLLLVLGLACRPGVFKRENLPEAAKLGAIVLASWVALIVLGYLAEVTEAKKLLGLRYTFALTLGLLLIGLYHQPMRQFATAVVLIGVVAFLPSTKLRGEVERSFFGVHRVTTSEDGKFRLLYHGTTIHGAQRLIDDAGNPIEKVVPVSYYHPQSPMTQSVQAARTVHAKLGDGPGRYAVVGLGSGSLACHAKAGETWRFYEIDPVVAEIARDPKKFKFLSQCQPEADIVLGDARLTLEKEADASLDYLLIDAFSSDSIPVHLLTMEAFQLYMQKLKPTGILALHISNRHLNLRPALAAVIDRFRGEGLQGVSIQDVLPKVSMDAVSSDVVAAARTPEGLAAIKAMKGAKILPAPTVAPWSDDHSDVLGALLAK